MTAVAAPGPWRPSSPAVAWLLGALALALLTVLVVLTVLTRDLVPSADGATAVIALSFGAVGVLVARRQPRNPIGWLLLGTAIASLLATDSELYTVLCYRVHHGGLPLGPAAALWANALWSLGFLIGTPALILFPDGRLPSPRWRPVMWVYVGASAVWLAGLVTGEASVIAGHRLGVDLGGSFTASPTGPAGTLYGLSWLFAATLPVIWLSWLGRQIGSYRRATDQRREQLKWLTGGAAICVISLLITEAAAGSNSVTTQSVAAVSRLAIAAFPVCMAVAILRYRLYEIDRVISRTLAYAIVTGLLVGLYAGLVLLATHVLNFKGPVTVAASTLAAVALFTPLRSRVQRVVDRRFNRARYDAERTVAAFSTRLKDATDIDAVRNDLLTVVRTSLEPAHLSMWLAGSDR